MSLSLLSWRSAALAREGQVGLTAPGVGLLDLGMISCAKNVSQASLVSFSVFLNEKSLMSGTSLSLLRSYRSLALEANMCRVWPKGSAVS